MSEQISNPVFDLSADLPGAAGVMALMLSPMIVHALWKQYTSCKTLRTCADDLKDYSSGRKKPFELD